jgi:tRNA pseudouridine55 synthase
MAPSDSPAPAVDGILVVDKPAGPTSHDVVDRVRRAIGTKRIGHTGTLDPFATGVLPLVVGRATRLAQFLTATDKSYDATIRLGTATDTYDATGQVAGVPASGTGSGRPDSLVVPERAVVLEALAAFVGTYLQTPPAFSAKKIDGVRAYVRAREGAPVEPASVVVSAHQLTLESLDADVVRISIRCSAGFYVRTLAHAVGERLGVGGHLEALRRTASGGFSIDEAIPLDVIEREGHAARGRLLPLSGVLTHMPAATLTEAGADRAGHGRLLSAGDFTALPAGGVPGPVRLIGPDGRLVAIARPGSAAGSLHPFVVMG